MSFDNLFHVGVPSSPHSIFIGLTMHSQPQMKRFTNAKNTPISLEARVQTYVNKKQSFGRPRNR